MAGLRTERPPELADGGFWYAIIPDRDGGLSFPERVSGCAFYGTEYAVIRTPDPVAGLPSAPVRVAAILGSSKPYARTGGR